MPGKTNDRYMDEHPDFAAEDIVPAAERRGLFFVRGSRTVYRCDAEQGTCECSDFLYRQAERHGQCKHLRRLSEYLRREKICGVCGGAGMIRLRAAYPGATEWPCAACEGRGTR